MVKLVVFTLLVLCGASALAQKNNLKCEYSCALGRRPSALVLMFSDFPIQLVLLRRMHWWIRP